MEFWRSDFLAYLTYLSLLLCVNERKIVELLTPASHKPHISLRMLANHCDTSYLSSNKLHSIIQKEAQIMAEFESLQSKDHKIYHN